MKVTRHERKYLSIFRFLTSEAISEVIITILEAKYCIFFTEQKGVANLYNVQIKSDKKILIVHFLPDNTIFLHLVSKESLNSLSYDMLKKSFLNDLDSVIQKTDYDRNFSNENDFKLKFHFEFKDRLPKSETGWKKVASIITV